MSAAAVAAAHNPAVFNAHPNLIWSFHYPVGAVVVFFVFRVSPGTVIHGYLTKDGVAAGSDGVTQILQLMMELDLIRKNCPDTDFALCPLVYNDMGASRHAKVKDHRGIHHLIQAVHSIKNNKVLVLFRDATRANHKPKEFELLDTVLQAVHDDVEVVFSRTPLVPSIDVKNIQHKHDQALLDMSSSASSKDVTYELVRSAEDEVAQLEIDSLACSVGESLARYAPLVITGANLGDTLLTGGIPLLRELMMEHRSKVLDVGFDSDNADALNNALSVFATAFTSAVNDKKNAHYFSYNQEQLGATSVAVSRRSPATPCSSSRRTQGTSSLSIFDNVDVGDVLDAEEGTVSTLPKEQTLFNIALIQYKTSLSDANADVNEGDVIFLHSEGEKRKKLFKSASIQALALVAHKDSKLKDVCSANVARAFTDQAECLMAMAIMQSCGVGYDTSYNFGFIFEDQVNAECKRHLLRELEHFNQQEELGELLQKQIALIVESSGLEDDVSKQLLASKLEQFSADSEKLSQVNARRYEPAKAITVSSESIKSLDDLTSMTSSLSLSHNSMLPDTDLNKDASLMDIVARNMIAKIKAECASNATRAKAAAIAECAKLPDGGGKYSSLEEMKASSKSNSMDLDDDGMEDNHPQLSDTKMTSTSPSDMPLHDMASSLNSRDGPSSSSLKKRPSTTTGYAAAAASNHKSNKDETLSPNTSRPSRRVTRSPINVWQCGECGTKNNLNEHPYKCSMCYQNNPNMKRPKKSKQEKPFYM